MNKKSIVIIFAFIITTCLQAHIKCRIKGKLCDTTQGRTVIICNENTDIRTSDRYITVKPDYSGNFTCDIETDRIELFTIFLKEQWECGSYSTNKFLIEDQAVVTLKFENNKWYVTDGGLEQQKKIKMQNKAENLYLSRLDSIEHESNKVLFPLYQELCNKGKVPQQDSIFLTLSNKYQNACEKLYKEYQSWELDYIQTHTMLYALYDMASHLRHTDARHEETNKRLMDIYHSTYENLWCKNPIHQTIHELEVAWLLKPGNTYIDFDAKTVDGKTVTVSSLYKDKVTLMNFWTSWCGPCRKHSMELIPIYEKYKDYGFNVIGVARENNIAKMINAAQKDGYPWLNLVDIKDEMKVWEKNGLSNGGGGIYLIDSNGTILSKSTDMNELEPLIRKALNLN